jgi:hypothetical protein
MRGRVSESAQFVGTTTGPLKEHPGNGTTVIFHLSGWGGYASQFHCSAIRMETAWRNIEFCQRK